MSSDGCPTRRLLTTGILLAGASLAWTATAHASTSPGPASTPAAAGDIRAFPTTAARALRWSGYRGPRGYRGYRGYRGLRGLRGYRGVRGAAGVRGPTGPDGVTAHGLRRQTVTVNWQNGQFAPRDRVAFPIPNIGTGEIVCRPDLQWLRVFVDDQSTDVTMWLVRSQDGLAPTVRTARLETGTGPDFAEGLNRFTTQSQTVGQFDGIISSRLARTSAGGPGPAPTSLHVAYTWDFSDTSSSRCYVAATFVTAIS